MKLSPDQKKVSEKMRPGVITQGGFLGDDTRLLPEIIQKDEERMEYLKTDWDMVSKVLRRFLKEGKKGLGEPITIDEKWLVKVDESRGFLPCPFGDGLHRKTTVTLKNKTNDKSLVYTALTLHLLKNHHFLQGKGSFFRLEPDTLKEVLEL
ncbi:MAG: hypothetical protein JXR70_02785 [Spirochaetales bacterium]|nr:hypothetical protein [Spirochaetales bacterium]